MSTVIKILIFISISFCSERLNQEPQLFSKNSGFGFTMGNSGSGNILTSLLSSTINIVNPTYYAIINTSSGKLEPSIGYFGMKDGENSMNMLSLGLGLLKNTYQGEKIQSYVGIRTVYARMSIDDGDSETVFGLSPVSGAEYFFNENFSVGGETRFTFLKPSDETDVLMQNLDSVLFFRFYLKK